MAFIIYILGVITGALGISLWAIISCGGKHSREEERSYAERESKDNQN